MKIITILLAGLLFALPVRADYSQSYSDYQYLYSQYRKSYQEFTVAKATYQTYKTLTTQNEALEKMRTTMTDRSNIVSAYLNLILEKMRSSEGIPLSQITTYQKIVDSQNSWLNGHQKQIAAAATLEDLSDISSAFDSQYPQILNETKKAVGIILISKNDFAYSKMPDLFNRVETQLSRLPGAGEDNLAGLRGLAVAKSKAQLWEGKRAAAMILFNSKQHSYNETMDLYKAQQLMIEGLQYLKEATSYLREIITGITL